MKSLAGERKIITVTLLKAEDVFELSSYIFK